MLDTPRATDAAACTARAIVPGSWRGLGGLCRVASSHASTMALEARSSSRRLRFVQSECRDSEWIDGSWHSVEYIAKCSKLHWGARTGTRAPDSRTNDESHTLRDSGP